LSLIFTLTTGNSSLGLKKREKNKTANHGRLKLIACKILSYNF